MKATLAVRHSFLCLAIPQLGAHDFNEVTMSNESERVLSQINTLLNEVNMRLVNTQGNRYSLLDNEKVVEHLTISPPNLVRNLDQLRQIVAEQG